MDNVAVIEKLKEARDILIAQGGASAGLGDNPEGPTCLLGALSRAYGFKIHGLNAKGEWELNNGQWWTSDVIDFLGIVDGDAINALWEQLPEHQKVMFPESQHMTALYSYNDSYPHLVIGLFDRAIEALSA